MQAVKDVFADSEDELDSKFPGMSFDEYCKEIMNKSGVTFAARCRQIEKPIPPHVGAADKVEHV